ncbi:DUF4296 domain-containing protein [Myroides injenensis]|uniref:DUF4296 domain-containing protein n=1 Tax=Myroides injenensis TaxID=1183151 RepID=UPI0002893C6A|nr:DUF4296 domain-containing protein [Myroides injenensis]
MNRNILLLLLLAVFIVSCDRGIKKPNPLIEKDKMENILYDIALLYGAYNVNVYRNDTMPQVDINSVLAKYKIDSLTFAENNQYYINLNKGVYLEMQMNIEQRIDKNIAIIDSLNNLPIDTEIKVDSLAIQKLDTIQGPKETLEKDSLREKDIR